MKIQSPPGMRDFYPQDMRVQNWLFDAWRRTSLAFGFSEYEGPIFEYLDLYTLKSGEGIVSELFNFKDRGERHFAIRPEMTPTLARMVAARANALPRPIKWFSIPRMCRAEKPQRGRLREFYQWNIDVLGAEDPLADAEVIAAAVAFFQQVGLAAEDVVVHLSSRPVVAATLAGLGIPPDDNDRAFQLIDRQDRLQPDEFATLWNKAYGQQVPADRLLSLLAEASMSDCLDAAESTSPGAADAVHEFRTLWDLLDTFGVRDFCEFDLRTVRGLAYYTGAVFEFHARAGGLRALAGGGRYDDLTGLLDGPRVPGVGFGMGDAPVLGLLKDLGKLPSLHDTLDVYLIDADRTLLPAILRLAATLRQHRLAVDFSYKRAAVGKQFKHAAARGARYAIVVGSEYTDGAQLTVKNLATGHQELVSAEGLLDDPQTVLAAV